MKYLSNGQKNKKNEYLAERVLNEFSDDVLLEIVKKHLLKRILNVQKRIDNGGVIENPLGLKPKFSKPAEIVISEAKDEIKNLNSEIATLTVEKIRNNPHDYAGYCGYYWHNGEYKKST